MIRSQCVAIIPTKVAPEFLLALKKFTKTKKITLSYQKSGATKEVRLIVSPPFKERQTEAWIEIMNELTDKILAKYSIL